MVILEEDGSATVRLRDVRLSFPNLFTPRVNTDDSGKEKKTYGSSFLFPGEGDPNDNLKHAKIALEHVIKVGLKGKHPGKERVCLKNGEDKGLQGVEGYDETMFFISSNSKDKPVCVDKYMRGGVPVSLTEEDGKLYGGCYVNATVRFWPMDSKQYGRRVCAQVKAVQFWRDGEPFGAPRVDAAEEFGDTSEEEEPGNVDDLI